MNTFSSFSDFFKRLFDLFRGPTFYMTFRRTDPKFREKVILTVSMANNCGA